MSAQISELVTLAKNGSAEAFGELYEIYYKDMYCYACYVTGSESTRLGLFASPQRSKDGSLRYSAPAAKGITPRTKRKNPSSISMTKTGDLTSRACSTISTSLSSFATPCRRLRPMRGR